MQRLSLSRGQAEAMLRGVRAIEVVLLEAIANADAEEAASSEPLAIEYGDAEDTAAASSRASASSRSPRPRMLPTIPRMLPTTIPTGPAKGKGKGKPKPKVKMCWWHDKGGQASGSCKKIATSKVWMLGSSASPKERYTCDNCFYWATDPNNEDGILHAEPYDDGEEF